MRSIASSRPLRGWLAGLLVAALAWDRISLPYGNPHGIRGALADAAFNPASNTVRFLALLVLPALGWWIAGGASRARIDLRPRGLDLSGWRFRVPIALLVALGVGQALGAFTDLVGAYQLDFFHDGDHLAPALKWLRGEGLWTSSYFSRGALFDPGSALFGWKLFGRESLGAWHAGFGILLAASYLSLCALGIVLLRTVRALVSPRLGRCLAGAPRGSSPCGRGTRLR
jgi:hypothetical protein